MTETQISDLEIQLLKFVNRVIAREEKATAAEVEALPAVAVALAEIHKLY